MGDVGVVVVYVRVTNGIETKVFIQMLQMQSRTGRDKQSLSLSERVGLLSKPNPQNVSSLNSKLHKVVGIRLPSNLFNTYINQVSCSGSNGTMHPIPSHNNPSITTILRRWPLLMYAIRWTTVLTVTVAVASFSPEAAFVSAISPSSSFSRACQSNDTIRVPLDMAGEILCLPAHRFTKSNIDLIVPPVFAAVVVAGSAFLVGAAALHLDG